MAAASGEEASFPAPGIGQRPLTGREAAREKRAAHPWTTRQGARKGAGRGRGGGRPSEPARSERSAGGGGGWGGETRKEREGFGRRAPRRVGLVVSTARHSVATARPDGLCGAVQRRPQKLPARCRFGRVGPPLARLRRGFSVGRCGCGRPFALCGTLRVGGGHNLPPQGRRAAGSGGEPRGQPTLADLRAWRRRGPRARSRPAGCGRRWLCAQRRGPWRVTAPSADSRRRREPQREQVAAAC